MKKSYSVTITGYEKIQPTHEEVMAAVSDLMARKVAEVDPRNKPSFKIEVMTDFSRK